ncbi:myosin-binding protein 3 [Ananas comosus]|uniref:Myosin-binding protein 3 n=1 Tax=Ananas comosus TaxID=4615 RepID=A0A6P5EFK9_ANACO|nr:myosin-binding protein 3 [Ananas comosus]XP_020080500.1 myosin-binding protein 3 [Ananas comosus]
MKEIPRPRLGRRSSRPSSIMARSGSKFEAVLRRNTDRISFVLIYTLLEWLLIALLLVDGLLSSLASRFAAFFGLHPPCVLCSRLSADRRRRPLLLLCDAHAADLSRLGFCSLHRRLAPAADMCHPCSSSRPTASSRPVAALLSYDAAHGRRGNRFTCSCCEADFGDGGEFAPPYFLLQPSWDAAVGDGREDRRLEGLDGDFIFDVEDGKIGSVLALDQEDDNSIELVALQFSNAPDEERRLPLELIDSITEMKRSMGVEEKAVSHSADGISNHEREAEASSPEEEARACAEEEEEEDDDDDNSADAEANCEISIGSEICDEEQPAPARFQEQVREMTSTESLNDAAGDEGQASEPELHEVVEDGGAHETPTHSEVIHGLHKRFFFERRESGAEPLDGSLAGELDGGEPISVGQLRSALKSEREALNALYAELEEERSASAVAASETMAMINRLQEEKAAMKMEALQYQRMMEEQSEYDQEALQLLNELLVKREKEKQELEKELGVYRERVLIYETKELKRTERQKKNGKENGLSSPSSTSSTSSSAEESDDGLLFDYCEGGDMACSLDQSNGTTTDVQVETAKHLVDESLADFEEERLSILEQLKTLEERLFTLENEDSDHVQMTEDMSEGNHHELNGDHRSLVDISDGAVNGFSDVVDDNIGKLHYEGKNAGCRGKRLLPLFDAAAFETEDGVPAEQDAVLGSASPEAVSELAKEQEKLLIAEEIDDLYDRLQALEADREFLKHCIKSLKKGDKGLNLLEEILQHLRDLRSVELRVRKAGDDAVALQTV